MKRSSFLGCVVALLLVTASAGSAMAQGGGRRGGGMMGRGGGLQILRLNEVQKELKMTPEQISKLDAKQDEVRQGMQQVFQSGGGNPGQMSPEDRQKFMDKITEIQDKAVADVLDATQLKRYHQLELQQQGPSALARPKVAAELKLTDEQKKKISDAQRQLDEDRRSAMQGADFQNMSPEERTSFMTKLQGLQKASGEKMLAVLTDAQKAQWKELQGAPFTFPAMGPGGFGGGRRPSTGTR